MAYAWEYAYAHPPFNWLGNFSLSQWQALKAWISVRQGDIPAISMFHRIRAEQLRKTAGLLERYYQSVYPNEPSAYGQKLSPTFQKAVWQPGPDGHFNYASGDDHLPMIMVSRIKRGMKGMLQRDEDAVYGMNQVRCLIEKHEDWAQYAHDFTLQRATGPGSSPRTLSELLAKIDSSFANAAQLNLDTVLVDDVNAQAFYNGQPLKRVNQADDMTAWEKEQANHSPAGTPINLVDRGVIDPSS